MITKRKKVTLITILAVIIAWGMVVATDYQLCKWDKPPIFAVLDTGTTDVLLYRGLGYHIIRGAWDPDWRPDKEPSQFRHCFLWGW